MADKAISDLTSIGTKGANDLFVVVEYSSGVTKKESRGSIVSGAVSDSAYGSGWNGVVDVAPSKNAVYDKIETLASGYLPLDGSRDMDGNITFANDGEGAEWSDGSSVKSNATDLTLVSVGETRLEPASGIVNFVSSDALYDDTKGVTWVGGSSIKEDTGAVIFETSEHYEFNGGDLLIGSSLSMLSSNIGFNTDNTGVTWTGGSFLKEDNNELLITSADVIKLDATAGYAYLEDTHLNLDDAYNIEWAGGSYIRENSGDLEIQSASEVFTFPSDGGVIAVGRVLYPINIVTQTINPADSSTYYMGCTLATSTVDGDISIPLVNGTIDSITVIVINQGTLGSSETSSLYIRVDTTDTLISNTVATDAAKSIYTLTGLSIATTTSNSFQLKFVTPAYATNPTSVRFYCVLNIKTT